MSLADADHKPCVQADAQPPITKIVAVLTCRRLVTGTLVACVPRTVSRRAREDLECRLTCSLNVRNGVWL